MERFRRNSSDLKKNIAALKKFQLIVDVFDSSLKEIGMGPKFWSFESSQMKLTVLESRQVNSWSPSELLDLNRTSIKIGNLHT